MTTRVLTRSMSVLHRIREMIYPKPVSRYKDPNFPNADWDEVVEKLESDRTFHLGQSYEEIAATTLACAKCGSRKFNVGSGDRFVVIRCPRCAWEHVISDG